MKNWKSYLNKPNIKVNIKENGSDLSKEFPYIMLDLTLNSCLTFDQVAKAFLGPQHRIIWDSSNLQT